MTVITQALLYGELEMRFMIPFLTGDLKLQKCCTMLSASWIPVRMVIRQLAQIILQMRMPRDAPMSLTYLDIIILKTCMMNTMKNILTGAFLEVKPHLLYKACLLYTSFVQNYNFILIDDTWKKHCIFAFLVCINWWIVSLFQNLNFILDNILQKFV